MTPQSPDPERPVSTAGSWLGFATAAWAAVFVCANLALVAAVASIPIAVEQVATRAEQEAGSADFPTQISARLELLEEFCRIVRPFADAVGGAGALLGFALFAAGATLVAGAESGRRAARALLALVALHLVGAAAWLVHLTTRLDDWNDRWRRAHDAFEATHELLPRDFGPIAARVGTQLAAGAGCSLALVVLLFWLAGRPGARAWCAARGERPVAIDPGRR